MTGSGAGNQWIEKDRESEGEASARPHGDQEHAAGSGKTLKKSGKGLVYKGLGSGRPWCAQCRPASVSSWKMSTEGGQCREDTGVTRELKVGDPTSGVWSVWLAY